jgi:endonuclease-3
VKDADIHDVVRVLKREIKSFQVPVVGVFAESRDPFLVLVSCVLSLRTRDKTTFEASERLFAFASTAEKLAAAPVARIEKAIYPVSFYRVKARSLKKLAGILVKEHGGAVPKTMEGLLSLPGVGRKTANLTLTLGHELPGICVDIHVHRISNRLGYIRTKTPDESELVLRAKLPEKYWMIYNDLLVPYGQNVCAPISPKCGVCKLSRYCAKKGVTTHR